MARNDLFTHNTGRTLHFAQLIYIYFFNEMPVCARVRACAPFCKLRGSLYIFVRPSTRGRNIPLYFGACTIYRQSTGCAQKQSIYMPCLANNSLHGGAVSTRPAPSCSPSSPSSNEFTFTFLPPLFQKSAYSAI